MGSATQRWIDAGTRIARDPDAKVACPACSAAELDVTVVEHPDAGGWDLYLVCPACGAQNVVTKRSLEQPPSPTHQH